MLRRRRTDPRRDQEQIAKARRAAEEAARKRKKVEASDSEIMGEVRKHKAILKRNNFAERWRAALGGAGR